MNEIHKSKGKSNRKIYSRNEKASLLPSLPLSRTDGPPSIPFPPCLPACLPAYIYTSLPQTNILIRKRYHSTFKHFPRAPTLPTQRRQYYSTDRHGAEQTARIPRRSALVRNDRRDRRASGSRHARRGRGGARAHDGGGYRGGGGEGGEDA